MIVWEMPMIDAIVAWDMDDDPSGNVQHIADHGITQEEVEEVLLNENNLVGESGRADGPSPSGKRPQVGGSQSSGKKRRTIRW
jgi:hypothetical protein